MLKKITVLFLFFLLIIPCCFAEEKDIEVSRDKGGIYIFKIPLNKYKDKIKPYVSEELTTTKEVFNNKDLNFKLVVNGGFFDPNTGEPASIVKIDGKTVESIFSNTELMKSLEESGRIEEVLNKTLYYLDGNIGGADFVDKTPVFDNAQEAYDSLVEGLNKTTKTGHILYGFAPNEKPADLGKEDMNSIRRAVYYLNAVQASKQI